MLPISSRLIFGSIESQTGSKKYPKGVRKELSVELLAHLYDFFISRVCVVGGVNNLAAFLRTLCESMQKWKNSHLPRRQMIVNNWQVTEGCTLGTAELVSGPVFL